jgi:hypothetical protein
MRSLRTKLGDNNQSLVGGMVKPSVENSVVKLICEGGINWNWFTKLEVLDSGVRIIWHDRFHKCEPVPFEWSQVEHHPKYHGWEMWKEDDKRNILEYYVPEVGWMMVLNPKYIFDYPYNGE